MSNTFSPSERKLLEERAAKHAGSAYIKNHQPKLWDERYNSYIAGAEIYAFYSLTRSTGIIIARKAARAEWIKKNAVEIGKLYDSKLPWLTLRTHPEMGLFIDRVRRELQYSKSTSIYDIWRTLSMHYHDLKNANLL